MSSLVKSDELLKIIKKTVNKDADILELSNSEIELVIKYVHQHHLKLKVFGLRGFDVLTNMFFVFEYKYSDDEDLFFNFDVDRLNFDTFEAYFNYVNGKIYEKSCYYGCSFSDEEIEKYQLDIKSLNFKSFSKENIKQFSFKRLYKFNQLNSQTRRTKVEKAYKWLSEVKTINSYDEFLSIHKNYSKLFKFSGADKIFTSYLSQLEVKDLDKYLADHYFVDNADGTIYIENYLLSFGDKYFDYILENYNSRYCSTTKRKEINSLKRTHQYYLENDYEEIRYSEFSENFQVYICVNKRIYKDGEEIGSEVFFPNFNDFKKHLNFELTNCDLSKASLCETDFCDCKITDTTLLPKSNSYSTYKISKYYDNSRFYVSQKWYDEDKKLILKDDHEFFWICDFIYFLNGDLSNSDLLFCEGIENLKNLNLDLNGILCKSEIAEKLNLNVDYIPEAYYESTENKLSKKYELETVDNLFLSHTANDDYDFQIGYVSDIHLIHRIKANNCKSFGDCKFVIKDIIRNINNESCELNLIAGDIASNSGLYSAFIKNLATCRGDYFVTLGNHEIWGFPDKNYEEKIKEYRTILSRRNIHFVNDNLFYLNDTGIHEIGTEQLKNINCDELRKLTRDARLVIFGGIGFAGYNEMFNAKNNIYRGFVDRNDEILYSNRFEELYFKVGKALGDKNVIILTHMPLNDWCKGNNIFEKFVYVSGHNHMNTFFDDGRIRNYSDNQIGYFQKEVHLKHLSLNRGYDWFSDYKDGIYEITKSDYEKFYRGINERISFNRNVNCIYMVKRENVYMFFIKNEKGNLLLLNGGSIRRTENNDLNYYFNNIVNYSKSVQIYLTKFNQFQKEISHGIKTIGGDGYIHGSIVDIDFYNHLYVNPLDFSITPYFAYSMVDKTVYKNLPSLLSFRCKKLYENFKKEIETNSSSNALIIKSEKELIDNHTKYVSSTEMYRISRILKGLQFTTNYNVIRLWNDALLQDSSEEVGKQIVQNIIYPEIEIKDLIK